MIHARNALLPLAVAAALAAVPSSAQTAGAKIMFNEEVRDYGQISFGGNGVREFTFKNFGTAPLIITNATSSCGCVVPSWSKEPIQPGKYSQITVKYDTKRAGAFAKTITVTSNAVNSPTVVLSVKGTVSPAS